MINCGDVYLVSFERGFWGAFKVLKKGTPDFSPGHEFFIVAVLDIVATEKPLISDDRLRHVLRCNRFFFTGRREIAMVPAAEKNNKIGHHERLGNLPLTEFEQSLTFALGSGQDQPDAGTAMLHDVSNFSHSAFLEWRWTHEHDAMVQEAEDDKQKRSALEKNRVMAPKKMMADDTFWPIIALLDWKAGDNDGTVKPVIGHLAKLKVIDIRQFEENLAFKLYSLDTRLHASHIGEYSYDAKDDYVSVDQFLYARCAVVVNGQACYERALKNPKHMLKDLDFEPLIYVAAQAYTQKTKKDLDYLTGCDKETFSNKAGWPKLSPPASESKSLNA